jgi:hypothetical protein
MHKALSFARGINGFAHWSAAEHQTHPGDSFFGKFWCGGTFGGDSASPSADFFLPDTWSRLYRFVSAVHNSRVKLTQFKCM